MQIVIDITDSDKEIIDNGFKSSEVSVNFYRRLITAIQQGTPLPKGHGRLMDADESIKVLKSLGSRDYRRERGTIQEAIKMLNYEEYTSTIIEADKEE